MTALLGELDQIDGVDGEPSMCSAASSREAGRGSVRACHGRILRRPLRDARRVVAVSDSLDIEQIVDFGSPPVVEVALGVQFTQSVIDLEVLAELARALRTEFPHRQQIEPLMRVSERFERPGATGFLDFRLGVPLPRTWFVSTDQRYLLQAQSDRLIFNWRRVEVGDAYPRYRAIRPKFDELRERLGRILADLGRPAPVIDLVEVTYINELAGLGPTSPEQHPPLGRLLRTVSDLGDGTFLPEPEDAGFVARYRIAPEEGGQPIGRLAVRTDPGYRTSDHQPIYLLNLTANIVGNYSNDDQVKECFDLGRKWVVRGFLDLTATDLQQRWEPETWH